MLHCNFLSKFFENDIENDFSKSQKRALTNIYFDFDIVVSSFLINSNFCPKKMIEKTKQ